VTERRRRLGAEAEQLVADRYAADGYHIEARNWRCALGEIDLIVARADVIIFVEVRSTSGAYLASPTMTVSGPKQHRIARAADLYLARRPVVPRDIRFDVVGVMFGQGRGEPRIDRIEDAFTPPWAF
jgi:putative endonuclease